MEQIPGHDSCPLQRDDFQKNSLLQSFPEVVRDEVAVKVGTGFAAGSPVLIRDNATLNAAAHRSVLHKRPSQMLGSLAVLMQLRRITLAMELKQLR